MAKPRVAAGALFFDDQDNVLLVKPTYKDGWDIPGGYVEPGETPVESCQREIKEELGLEMQVRGLLVVDWAPSEGEGDKVLFVFDGGMITRGTENQLSLPRDELMTFAFQPPEAFDDLMPARLARRLRAAISARERGAVEYLEHGETKPRRTPRGTEKLRQVVESQIIKSIGYDKATAILEVEFRNGWVYEYDDVPKAIHRAFLDAPSHGKYLKRNIVDRFVTRRTR